MNKRIFALLMLVACLPLFCGCQLANPEAGSTQPDQLVGVHITINQDLSMLGVDMDSFMFDNIDSIMNGIIPAYPKQKQERIYGEPMEKVCTDVDGVEYTDQWYEFSDIDGVQLATYLFTDGYDSNGEPIEYRASHVDEEVSDFYYTVDEVGPTEIKGTVYINSNVKEICVFLNPVYQTESGEVYLLPGGEGFNLTENNQDATLSISETYTDEYGETRETKVSITFEPAEPCETVTFLQIDSENNVLRKDTFASTEIPDELTPQEDTSYIIVEEYSKNGIERSMYDKDDYFIKVPCFGVRGLLPIKSTTLKWPDSEI